jgi:hypothetical protein
MGSDHLRRYPSQAEPSVFLELLQYLLANKAPANDYDNWGEYVAIAPLGSAYFVILLTCPVRRSLPCFRFTIMPLSPIRHTLLLRSLFFETTPRVM